MSRNNKFLYPFKYTDPSGYRMAYADMMFYESFDASCSGGGNRNMYLNPYGHDVEFGGRANWSYNEWAANTGHVWVTGPDGNGVWASSDEYFTLSSNEFNLISSALSYGNTLAETAQRLQISFVSGSSSVTVSADNGLFSVSAAQFYAVGESPKSKVANSGNELPSWPEQFATATGTLAGMIKEGKVSGDMWYSPKAGKWFPLDNQPNGTTGPKNPVLKSSNNLQNFAKGAFYAGAIYSTGDMIYYYATGGTEWEKAAWTGADIAFGAIATFGGLPGMAIGIVYTITTTPVPNISSSPYYTDPLSPWNTLPRIDNTGVNNGGGF